jgi:transcriptional regulator with XRE-family HTH domain
MLVAARRTYDTTYINRTQEGRRVGTWEQASDIGDRLRELREYLGELRGKPMAQAEFGDMIGVSNQRVSDWESGRGRPARNRLVRMARRLGIPMTVFAANGPRPRQVTVRSPGHRLEQALDAVNNRMALLRDQFRSYHDNGLVPDETALKLWLETAQQALDLTRQLADPSPAERDDDPGTRDRP